MVSWLGKDEQDFNDFDYFGFDFGGDFNDFNDLGLSLAVIAMISLIWGGSCW